MKLFVITALIAVCGSDKLDRTYLPPPSAKTAGGSASELQAPRNSFNNGLGGLPKGSYENEFQGVVVDAAAAGTRASGPEETGLGAPRIHYGSTDSKVGAAAFKTQPSAFQTNPQGAPQFQNTEQYTSQSFTGPQGFSSNFDASQSFQRPQTQGLNNQNVQSTQGLSNPERERASLERQSTVLRYENEVGPENYHFAFETDNGIAAGEDGVATNGVQAQGGYSYTGDDGQVYSVSYTADEGGYQPKGNHLPTPPPIPDEILKSLEQNAKEEAAGIVDDGSYDAQKYSVGNDYNDSENTNGKYQSSKFGGEADAVSSGTFIDQNQALRKPSYSHSGFNVQESSKGQNGKAPNKFSTQAMFSSPSSFASNQQPPNNFNIHSEQTLGKFTSHPEQAFQRPSIEKNVFSTQGSLIEQDGKAQNIFPTQGKFSSAGFVSHQQQSSGFNTPSNKINDQSVQSSKSNIESEQASRRYNQHLQPSSEAESLDVQTESNQSGHPVSLGQNNKFGSFSSATHQTSSRPTGQARPTGNINEYLPPIKSNGRPQNNRQQYDRLQNDKPQTAVSGAISNKDTSSDEEGSGDSVPLGQQDLQSEIRPQQTVTSFGQDISNARGLPGQNKFSSSNVQNRPNDGNGRRPSNRNGVTHAPSSFSGNVYERNEYISPQQVSQNRRPSNSQQSSSQFSQEYISSTDGQVQIQEPSQTSLPTSPTFEPRPQQTNAYQRPETSRPVLNGNKFQTSYQTQFNQGSAQPTYDFKPQKPTSQPATELTTPFESANNNYEPTASLASFVSTRPVNGGHPTQQTFAGQYNTVHNNLGSQIRPQSSQALSQKQGFASPSQSPLAQSPQFVTSQGFALKNEQEFSASTQRPSYTQPQGLDDSYIYNQPSRPFSTPQGSIFPSAPSGQFNRITQQSSIKVPSLPQDVNTPAISSSRPQGSSKYPNPPTIAPTRPTTLPQGSFVSQNNIRGSTKYPRPPTLVSSAPTFSAQTKYQPNTNGVTQASISPFPSQSPTQSSQYSVQNQNNSKPNYQSSQFGQNFLQSSPVGQQPTQPSYSQQSTASAFSKKPSSFQTQSQTFEQQKEQTDIDSEAPVPSQQYNGEIYEYTKPAKTLPPPDSTPASSTGSTSFNAQGIISSQRPQFGQTNDQEDQRPASQFGGSRPQFGTQSKPQITPQFGQKLPAQNTFGVQTQKTKEDTKPYGALAQSSFGSQSSSGPITTQTQLSQTQPQFSQGHSSFSPNQNLIETGGMTQQDDNISEKDHSDAEKTTVQPSQSQFGFGFNVGSRKPVQNQNQFGSQSGQRDNQSGQQSQSKPVGLEPACCKDDARITSPVQSPNQFGIQSHFGQTTFSGAQKQPPNSFAGKGEVFGGPRQPPRFDEATGYHY